MIMQLTLKEVLERGIEKEVQSRLLYIDLGQKVSDEAAKDAFQELAQQEKGHQNLIRLPNDLTAMSRKSYIMNR